MWKEFLDGWRNDNLLNQAWRESYSALNISDEMFREAVRILRESDDTEVDPKVRKKDKQIDEYQRAVRRKVITHCALRCTSGLPGGMVLVSIIIDIERIGDNAKNILDLAEAHPERLRIPAYDDRLTGIEEDLKWRFRKIVTVLKEEDTATARQMMDKHRKEIRNTCDGIIDDLVRGKVEGTSISDASALAVYVRYLKRISAHLKNIASSVVNPFDRIGFKEKRRKRI